MAVSDVSTWNPYLVQILRQALLNATAIDENENPAAEMYVTALFQLNAMVKALEATGLHVWAEEEAILFLQPLVARYVIGGSAPTAHTARATEWVLAELALAAIAGATTVTLESADGIADGDHIGIVGADGTTFWTTVDGAPAAEVVTLTDALEQAADAGALAFAYTTPITRPLKVPAARLLTFSGLLETPMSILSRQEYMDLPQKLSPGTPTQWFYSPQRDWGEFYVWPVGNTSAWAARFTWYRPLLDFLNPLDTSDFPQEWINPLIWNLSKEIAPSYGVPELTWNRIKEMADTWGMMALSYDRESEPIRFGMDYRTYGAD